MGYCDSAGKLPVQSHPTNLDYSREVKVGLVGHFFSCLSFLSSFSLSLGDDPI